VFTDWTEALEAESLPLELNPAQQLAAAARTTARSSRSKDDMALLLGILGLPTDEPTLTALLPLLPETGDAPTMSNTPAGPALSAHEAMAISMHNNGDTREAICEATGLSEADLSDLIAHQILGLPRTADTAPGIKAADTEDVPVEQLLAWAEAHPMAGIRTKAARVRGDLAELTVRRASDDAQRAAEERVAKLKAELEKAQEQLRAAKSGPRPASTATGPAPTLIRSGLGSGRSKEQLALIRSWARKNGHQVADAGVVRKSVLEAYDAAHQAPVRKAG
jgi:hypothetical protein